MVKWTYYLRFLIIATIICCVVEVLMICYSINGNVLFGTNQAAESVVNILVIVIPLIIWGIMMLVLCRKGKKQHTEWKLINTLMAIGTGIGGIGIGACIAYVIVAVLEKLLT